jgi:adenosylmethionine-8-amino-7-oxononanoate aminotransferase
VELVRDQQSDERFDAAEREELLRGYLGPRFYDAGLICRVDDRGDPVVQLAPPLVAGPGEFDFIAETLRTILGDASAKFCV